MSEFKGINKIFAGKAMGVKEFDDDIKFDFKEKGIAMKEMLNRKRDNSSVLSKTETFGKKLQNPVFNDFSSGKTFPVFDDFKTGGGNFMKFNDFKTKHSFPKPFTTKVKAMTGNNFTGSVGTPDVFNQKMFKSTEKFNKIMGRSDKVDTIMGKISGNSTNFNKMMGRTNNNKVNNIMGKITGNSPKIFSKQMFKNTEHYHTKLSEGKKKLAPFIQVSDNLGFNRIKEQKNIDMFSDKDNDGVANILDCQPFNRKRQDTMDWENMETYQPIKTNRENNIGMKTYNVQEENPETPVMTEQAWTDTLNKIPTVTEEYIQLQAKEENPVEKEQLARLNFEVSQARGRTAIAAAKQGAMNATSNADKLYWTNLKETEAARLERDQLARRRKQEEEENKPFQELTGGQKFMRLSGIGTMMREKQLQSEAQRKGMRDIAGMESNLLTSKGVWENLGQVYGQKYGNRNIAIRGGKGNKVTGYTNVRMPSGSPLGEFSGVGANAMMSMGGKGIGSGFAAMSTPSSTGMGFDRMMNTNQGMGFDSMIGSKVGIGMGFERMLGRGRQGQGIGIGFDRMIGMPQAVPQQEEPLVSYQPDLSNMAAPRQTEKVSLQKMGAKYSPYSRKVVRYIRGPYRTPPNEKVNVIPPEYQNY